MKILAVLLVAIALTAGCIGQSTIESTAVIETATGPVMVELEVADNELARGRGLMGRESLGENAGMLFVFNGEEIRRFWMKNTLIPLDILFISADNKIVDIQTMVPCEADPCPLYSSAEKATYALEVNAGFATKNGINPGDSVEFI